MKFNHYGDIIIQLEPLLDEWKVRSNLFYKLVRDNLIEATNVTEEKLKKKSLYDAFNEIRKMGLALDDVHTHLQDLGQLYNKIWDLVKDT